MAKIGNKNAFIHGKPKCIDCDGYVKYYKAKRCKKCHSIYYVKENHHKWKGGIARDIHGNTENKVWRLSVFTRDSFTCQVCKKIGVYLEAHHIKSWATHPELRYEITNGITLCKECHKLTDNYKGKNVQH